MPHFAFRTPAHEVLFVESLVEDLARDVGLDVVWSRDTRRSQLQRRAIGGGGDEAEELKQLKRKMLITIEHLLEVVHDRDCERGEGIGPCNCTMSELADRKKWLV